MEPLGSISKVLPRQNVLRKGVGVTPSQLWDHSIQNFWVLTSLAGWGRGEYFSCLFRVLLARGWCHFCGDVVCVLFPGVRCSLQAGQCSDELPKPVDLQGWLSP